MRTVLKEPLIHFLVLGGLLFAYFQWKGGEDTGDASESAAEIVVTKGKVQSLTEQFIKVWQRQPTSEELQGLVKEHIREEVMYREALGMGLDWDDTIVRRRMRQKLEFLSEDIAALAEPSDDELAAYLKTNADAYRTDSIFTFKQVYLNAGERGEAVAAAAEAVLAQLFSGGEAVDISQMGDRLMLGQVFEATPQREVASKFGTDFASALQKVPVGEWQQLSSGFGVHLVYISERKDGELPGLAEVRDAVARDWSSKKREETNETFYQQLLKRYTVTVEEIDTASSTEQTLKEVAAR